MICDRYKKDQESVFIATCSMHNLLTACLLSEAGPPLLDFEVIWNLLFVCSLPPFINFLAFNINTYSSLLKHLNKHHVLLIPFLVETMVWKCILD